MLWKYAPADVMVGGRPTGSVCGASGRGLQMGRRRWRRPLLRSALSRRREDLHLLIHILRLATRAAPSRRLAGGVAQGRRGGDRTRLQRIFHRLAGKRSDLFRRRRHCRELKPRADAQTQSEHRLALERQAAGRCAGRRCISAAASGSRHVRTRRHHHRSSYGPITEQRQRHVLRKAAVRAGAAAQVVRSLLLAGA
jgi:hypothetical protein